MRKLLLLAFALTMGLAFTSCEEDTADDNPINPGDILEGGLGVAVESNITSDRTWDADSVYILSGRISVESGATLTIEAGTIIKGRAGTGANASALVVARGATLNAEGTAAAPIIFTSIADEIAPGEKVSPNLDPSISGLWGGVIVLGNAPISVDGDNPEAAIEGIPTSDSNGLYGGSAAADNSGSISYISIRHGGSNIGEGNEINGLTLGGVGNGTTIEGVEVVANADDGIEWFGGTVNVSKVLIWNSNDDGLDTDQDWQGTCSDYVIVTPQGGSGFELDGPEGTSKVNGADGYHTFSNGVLYAGDNIDHLVDWDGSTNAFIDGLHFYGLDSTWISDGSTPIESFSGDSSAISTNWETMIPANSALTKAQIFEDADAITTEVNSRTHGPAASEFEGWTWAALSGALTEIGL